MQIEIEFELQANQRCQQHVHVYEERYQISWSMWFQLPIRLPSLIYPNIRVRVFVDWHRIDNAFANRV